MRASSEMRKLVINLNDCRVGEITRLPDDRTVFTFDESYKANAHRPVLSLSFKALSGDLVQVNKIQKEKLHPFFSNLLPEGYLRNYLVEKLKLKTQREFFFLSALGDDLPGAVRVDPSGELIDDADVKPETRFPAESDGALRFSLAGVQLKFSSVLEASGRLTIPVQGQGGSWIVKLPAGKFGNVPDAEFAMMTLAKHAGIEVPEFNLLPANSIGGLPSEFQQITGDSFAIRRFDRTADGRRIHAEDFAQVFALYADDKYKKRSYANIAEVLWVEAGEKSVAEFIRRLVFNLMIGNGDMHLKNWSVLYRDPLKPELSPAYDFIPTVAFLEKQSLGLSLGGTKEFAEVDATNFKKMAATAKIPERFIMKLVDESKEASYAAWQEHKSSLPITSKVGRAIEHHIHSLSLFKATLVPGSTLPSKD